MTWDDLTFWDTGEWQAIEEKLDDLEKSHVEYCPNRELLFAAMDACSFDAVRACILGQDPYPNPMHATGIAFSIPKSIRHYPPTLVNIFDEYVNDLHYPRPKNGDLTKWCEQGVFLWNVIPTCLSDRSMSHAHWEWEYLTKEIIERLDPRGIVFVFLGGVAREYTKYVVPWGPSDIIECSHPSPRGAHMGANPFLGSRLFTTINDRLTENGLTPIDWRL